MGSQSAALFCAPLKAALWANRRTVTHYAPLGTIIPAQIAFRGFFAMPPRAWMDLLVAENLQKRHQAVTFVSLNGAMWGIVGYRGGSRKAWR